MRNYKRARELLRYSIFETFGWKRLVKITQFKNQNIANFDLFSFSVPREEICSVTGCKRTGKPRNTRSFPNNNNQGSSSADNIYQPELQIELQKLRMRNYKRARELLRYFIFKTFVWKTLVEITQFKGNNLPILTYFLFQFHEKRSAV